MSHLTHPFEIRRVGNDSVLVCRNMATVRIGVFAPGRVQLLDLACVDIFHLMGKASLAALGLPESLVDQAPHVEISYISAAPAGTAIPASANARLVATHSVRDDDVQPGKLDILLVPGPGTAAEGLWSEEVLEFIRGHAGAGSTDILMISAGACLCGEAGVLKGRTVAGPRGLGNAVTERHRDVNMVGDKFRWTQDGRLWSSGGMTNGNDLVAAYALRSPHFAKPVAELGIAMAEVELRPQEY